MKGKSHGRTKLHQVLLRLPADTWDRVSRLIRQTGMSRNKLMARLLEEMLPDLEAIAEAVSAARNGSSVRTARALRTSVNKALAVRRTRDRNWRRLSGAPNHE